MCQFLTAKAIRPVTIPALTTAVKYFESKVKFSMEEGFMPFFKSPT